MWARRLIDRMIAAESEGHGAEADDTLGVAAVAAGAAATAERPRRVEHGDGTDLPSRFDQPATLMQRGL
jgi:hypothetical protein